MLASIMEEVPEQFARSRQLLNAARFERGIGHVDECKHYAAQAYEAAHLVDDYETVYQSRACVGRLHRYRGEHGPALEAYRAALREVECHVQHCRDLRAWLGPAYHECFVEAMMLGYADEVAPFAVSRMDLWQESPKNMYAFVQDFGYLKVLRDESQAKFLHQTALQATWYTQHPFERMIAFASQALAAGTLQHPRWYEMSRKKFDHAVGELGGMEEGVAMQSIDVAMGAERIGDTDNAVAYAAQARHIAGKRNEAVLHERAEQIMMRLGTVTVHHLNFALPTAPVVEPDVLSICTPGVVHQRVGAVLV